MFYFSEEERKLIYEIVKSEYPSEADKTIVQNSLDTLEKLLSCDVAKQEYYIDIDSIKKACNISYTLPSVNFVVIEGIMKKIIAIKNGGKAKTESFKSFKDCYVDLKIYESLNKIYNKKNKRGIDKELYKTISSYNVSTINEEWKDYPKYRMYVIAWKLRNIIVKGVTLNNYEKEFALKSFFVVLIELCHNHQDDIECQYLKELKNMFRQFVCDYKKHLKEEMQVNGRSDFFTKNYTAVAWGEENADLCWNDKNVIMYIGEAGTGKTTQMEKLYWDEINAEKEIRLPIWLQVRDLKKDLLEEIKDRLGGYREFSKELLKGGLITLYLDGLNERLIDDCGVGKEKLVGAIKELINGNPMLRVCMTDRTSDLFSQSGDKVKVFELKSMDDGEALEYYEEFFSSHMENGEAVPDWLVYGFSEFPDVREIAYCYNKMIADEKSPKNIQEFIEYYIEYLYYDKKEMDNTKCELSVLEMLLSDLAKSMQDNTDTKNKDDILGLFKNGLDNNSKAADEYFQLACQIPLLVECESGKYKFRDGVYFEFFNEF